MEAGDATVVKRFIGVYNASGTVLGELSYFIGARLGTRHCSLCTITHGRVQEKPEFCELRKRVPFETFHSNDAPPAVKAKIATGVGLAVVLAETADGTLHVAMDNAALEECAGPALRHVFLCASPICAGSVDAMSSALEARVRGLNLTWPA